MSRGRSAKLAAGVEVSRRTEGEHSRGGGHRGWPPIHGAENPPHNLAGGIGSGRDMAERWT